MVEPDVADLLPRLTWHMDEPTADPAIITAYLVCREARKQATVLLSGVGGDELFAGYRKHVGALLGGSLSPAASWVERSIAQSSLATCRACVGVRPRVRFGLPRRWRGAPRSGAMERFMMNCTYLDRGSKILFIIQTMLRAKSAVRSCVSARRGI